jgi:hypothetical protein
MAKLIADLFGVKNGDIYPKTFKAGADCPPELLEAAIEAKAVDQKEGEAALAKWRDAQAKAAAAAEAEAQAEAEAT